jgi:peptidoglycan/xylan/chitin deacetylase (PgdA/CDA1 family)
MTQRPATSPTAEPSYSPLPTVHVSTSPAPSADPSPAWNGVPASLVGTQWYTLPTSEKVVALTFDAGANADAVPTILATLAAKGVPATFFLTGRWVEAYPDLAEEIGATYPVGNHSYSHPDLTTLSDAEVRQELDQAQQAIQPATGQDPRPLFRFPFGAWSDHEIDLVNQEGYGAVNWTVDTRGWQGTSGGQTVDLVSQRVLDALQPGEIVIMHVGSNPDDGSTLDADALPGLIDAIRAGGYRFVLVTDFL